jgi:hypothetical protein
MTALVDERELDDCEYRQSREFAPRLRLVPAADWAADAPVAAAVRTPEYRLTRRGRLVVFTASLLIVAGLVVSLGSRAMATRDVGSLHTTSVTVMPGMTLWEIATEANPGGDTRATIDAIMRLNALPKGQSLPIGVQLEVPVYQD